MQEAQGKSVFPFAPQFAFAFRYCSSDAASSTAATTVAYAFDLEEQEKALRNDPLNVLDRLVAFLLCPQCSARFL